MLYVAFRNRGYSNDIIQEGLKETDWTKRDYYRTRALKEKDKAIPAGGAVFSIQIDPSISAALQAGFAINLSHIQSTSTAAADEEVQRALGTNLRSVFPNRGLVALKAARKLRAVCGGGQVDHKHTNTDTQMQVIQRTNADTIT